MSTTHEFYSHGVLGGKVHSAKTFVVWFHYRGTRGGFSIFQTRGVLCCVGQGSGSGTLTSGRPAMGSRLVICPPLSPRLPSLRFRTLCLWLVT